MNVKLCVILDLVNHTSEEYVKLISI